MSLRLEDALNLLESVTCYLGADWSFSNIEEEARNLGGHQVEDRQTDDIYGLLRSAAFDFEKVIRSRIPKLLPLDLANFWTSLQLFRHFERFADERLASSPRSSVSKARVFLHRRLAAYANGLRLDHQFAMSALSAESGAAIKTTARSAEKKKARPRSALGLKIQTYMDDEGYTITEFAAALKVSRQALNSAVSGGNRHGKTLLTKIGNKMGVDVAELLGD
jgi:hypothetical protein